MIKITINFTPENLQALNASEIVIEAWTLDAQTYQYNVTFKLVGQLSEEFLTKLKQEVQIFNNFSVVKNDDGLHFSFKPGFSYKYVTSFLASIFVLHAESVEGEALRALFDSHKEIEPFIQNSAEKALYLSTCNAYKSKQYGLVNNKVFSPFKDYQSEVLSIASTTTSKVKVPAENSNGVQMDSFGPL